MKSFRMYLSRVFIWVGLAIVAVSAAYEAYDYPWGALLNENTEPADDLPDPDPVDHLPEHVEIMPYNEAVKEAEEVIIEPTPEMPGADTATTPAKPANTTSNVPKVQYVQLGAFKIPKLKVSVNLFEGSNEEMMAGVVHVKGTAMPGEVGNAVFSGHRSYIRMHPFRHLDKLQSGDKIVIKFEDHVFEYVVTECFFVNPDEVWVMQNRKDERYLITLITCDPKIRPTRRLIVRGELSLVDGITPDEYFAATEADNGYPEDP